MFFSCCSWLCTILEESSRIFSVFLKLSQLCASLSWLIFKYSSSLRPETSWHKNIVAPTQIGNIDWLLQNQRLLLRIFIWIFKNLLNFFWSRTNYNLLYCFVFFLVSTHSHVFERLCTCYIYIFTIYDTDGFSVILLSSAMIQISIDFNRFQCSRELTCSYSGSMTKANFDFFPKMKKRSPRHETSRHYFSPSV
jgi:hypothetical protein